MKTRGLILVLVLGLIVSAFSQKASIELTFTAVNNTVYVVPDSIYVENLTQGGDTTLYAPDTVLVLDYVASIGSNETIGGNTLSVSQNYPNPFKGKTEVNLYLPEKENIKITVRDILGRELAQYKNTLHRGSHSFTFYAGNEKYYVFSAKTSKGTKAIKMANLNAVGRAHCTLVYNGQDGTSVNLKSRNAINSFVFNLGDELRYIGYAKTINEVNGSDVIEDAPLTNEIYVFDITEGIPCPGTPTVVYEGQVYNTVLIGSQCWLKENLNAGVMINGGQNQQNNDTIEKYCYNNNPVNCDTFGGLYQWNEMMQYTTTEGTQGICPDGWHLPTDEEWKQLEGEVDSQYGYPDPEWNGSLGWRGFDAGLNLKSTSGWNYNGNGTDEYGFTALPGGNGSTNGYFNLGNLGFFWSSTEYGANYAWNRMLHYDYDGVERMNEDKPNGFAVRCMQD